MARKAGLLYLAMAVTGAYGILYVPSKIIAPADVITTVKNMTSNEMLFRSGIISQLICQTVFIYLALTLKRLLYNVNEHRASQMLTLVVISVPITLLNLLNQMAVLLLLSDPDLQVSFEQQQVNTLIAVFFKLHDHGIMIAQIFWGLWLIPFGLLVFRSGFIPAILGVMLIIGGMGYVLASFTGLLFPAYGRVVGPIVTIPSAIAELSIIFWLLIRGVKNPGTKSQLLSSQHAVSQ